MMERMRDVAKQEDVPLSEIIRKATALWLDRFPRQEESPQPACGGWPPAQQEKPISANHSVPPDPMDSSPAQQNF